MTTSTSPTGSGSSPTNAHRASASTTASGQRSSTAAVVASSTRVAQAERRAAVAQGLEAGDGLRGRLPGGVHDLRRPGAPGAVEVQPGEAQVGGAVRAHGPRVPHRGIDACPCREGQRHERREDQRGHRARDKQARFEERFRGRAGAVEKTPGFEWFELLRPLEGTDQYLVYTRWSSEEAYQAWQSGQDFDRAHDGGGDTLAPAASRTRTTSGPTRCWSPPGRTPESARTVA